VLVPIELYRKMEDMLTPRLVSPHLVYPEDAERFHMEMITVGQSEENSADVPCLASF
jgi:hypothetical protein